jgi:N-acetylmuramoyl-L-alanine amidase
MHLAHPQRNRRRLIGAGGGLAVLVLLPASGAQPVAVRLWPGPEYSRLTIEHDGELRFHHFLLNEDHKPRLVVDVEGLPLPAGLPAQLRALRGDDPFVGALRVGQPRPGTTRFVLDLKAAVDPEVFALPPAGPYRRRLVIDLYPEGANDELMALVRGAQRQPELSRPEEAPQGRLKQGQQQAPSASAPEANHESRDARDAGGELPRDGSGDGRADGQSPAPGRRLVTIAIDPGHGGEDPGAVGHRGTREKDVTLAIARRLAQRLAALPDVRVLLTRDGDYFVPLATRVAKARRVQADLFVSIHADAWVRADAQGSSVFVLSQHGASSAAAAALAREQNDADLIGGVNLKGHSAEVRSVVLDLATSAQISDSLRFGDTMLHGLERVNRLHRGVVEQAGFAVLKAPDIPSILVETAFISNPEEEARLSDAGHQERLAQALCEGVREHLARNPPVPRGSVG